MIIGLVLVAFVQPPGVRYFGIFLATGGVTASVPAIYAYQTNNLRGQWKRGLSTALMVALGGLSLAGRSKLSTGNLCLHCVRV